MATLALGLAGAGLGEVAGIGSGVGWLLGSTLGRLIGGEEAGSAAAPLKELRLGRASYGEPLPILFGTVRLAGTVIWAAPLKRQKAASQSGGKGAIGGSASGSSGSQYQYFASFAVAIAEGELDCLLKIWADGELIYNAQSASATTASGLRFRFYPGSQMQPTDSLIAAHLEAGGVPAYRGVAYVVFEDFPLAGYGSRLPNMEFLASAKTADHFPLSSGAVTDLAPTQLIAVDGGNDLLAYHAAPLDVAARFDGHSLNEVIRTPLGDAFPELVNRFKGLAADRAGHVWAGTGHGMVGERRIHKINAGLMREVAAAILPSGIGAISHSVDIRAPLSGARFQVAGSQQSGQIVVFDQDLQVIASHQVASLASGGALRDETERAWIAMTATGSSTLFDDLEIISVSLTALPGAAGPNWEAGFEVTTIPIAQLTPDPDGESQNITQLLHYLKSRRTLVFQNDYRLFLFSLDSRTVTVTRDGNFYDYQYIGDGYSGDELVFLKSGRYVVYLDPDTLQETITVDIQDFAGVGSQDAVRHEWATDSLVLCRAGESLKRLYLRRQTGDDVSLASIFETLCQRGGLAPEEIETGGVSQTIGGYVLPRQMSLQAAVDPLLFAGRLQMVESDGKLKLRSAGGGESTDIPEADLLAPLEGSRNQESELPLSLTVSYQALEAGHEIGSQQARRSDTPFATQQGRQNETVPLSMALSAQAAKEMAVASLQTAWQERDQRKAVLPLKYLALEPADPVRLSGAGAAREIALSETHLGADFSLSVEGAGLSQFTADGVAVADPGSGYVELPIAEPIALDPVVLDIPLLQDRDATAGLGSRVYLGVKAHQSEDFAGAQILRSAAVSERYENWAEVAVQLEWGIAASALPPAPTAWRTDRQNKMLLRLADPEWELESVTDADLLNGANPLLVGSEIIQFRDAQLLPDGGYELSTLIRGRRGTEAEMTGHQVGEQVILLSPATLRSEVISLSELGSSYRYKAVGPGTLPEGASRHWFQQTGRDLMPYAPCQVRGVRSGSDLTIQWQRRSRVGSSQLSQSPPLAEGVERYELIIGYDSQSVSYFIENVRSFAYSLAAFNADFDQSLLDIPSLEVTLFQHSQAVGRGRSVTEII